MNPEDKKHLLHFISRMGMYISTQDKNNVISFITGYETGSGTCNFSQLFSEFISRECRIQAGATGWPGQIEQLSEQRAHSWLRTFRQVALQCLTENDTEDLRGDLHETIRKRMAGLVERIKEQGDPWFNEGWTEEWQSLCAIRSVWFRNLWTESELRAIQAMDTVIVAGNAFADEDKKVPSPELLRYKDLFYA